MYNFISAHKYEHVICIEIQRKRNHWTETQRTEEKEEEKAKCFSIYIYNEFPREEEFVDFRDEELCPRRLRDTNDKHNSFEDGYLSHSDSKHWSSVGLSDERIDKHFSINCIHSNKWKKNRVKLVHYKNSSFF
jgi:hypothetical protein